MNRERFAKKGDFSQDDSSNLQKNGESCLNHERFAKKGDFSQHDSSNLQMNGEPTSKGDI